MQAKKVFVLNLAQATSDFTQKSLSVLITAKHTIKNTAYF